MTVSASGNSTLNAISASYESSQTAAQEKEDIMGRESFLTMLVAQLENQDPLNPMDGTDFTAQLAQFSQLEQLINLNDTMESLKTAMGTGSEQDITDYLDKEISATVDSVEVVSGSASAGYYSLSRAGDVMIEIYDSDGNEVRTLYPGQKEAGTYTFQWDGTDNSGGVVEDGRYTYSVVADTGSGFQEVSTAISGEVDGITYENGKAYLWVNGVMVDPESLLSISSSSQESEQAASILDYLGKDVSSDNPLVLVDGGTVSGSELEFSLEGSEAVSLNIYDSSGSLVRTLDIPAEDTAEGLNTVEWDGLDESGNPVTDGIYTYSVDTASGTGTATVSGEVTGIRQVGGSQYLVLDENERLVTLSSITVIS